MEEAEELGNYQENTAGKTKVNTAGKTCALFCSPYLCGISSPWNLNRNKQQKSLCV